jgi:hypothetical protein
MWYKELFDFSEKYILKISVLFLLLLVAGNMNAQGNMRLPLKEGYVHNPTIQIDGLMIEPVNLYIQSRPWTTQSAHVQLEMKIQDRTDSYQTFLCYYEENNDQFKSNFPKGIGSHLFSLDVCEDGIDLLIDTLQLGDTFTFDSKSKKGVAIGGLTITYDSGYSGNNVNPDGSYAGCTVCHLLKLSDGSDEDIVTFMYDTDDGDEEIVDTKVWKGFKIELIRSMDDFLTLKVTRPSPVL